MTWIRIGLERDIYQIVLFKCETVIFYVPLGCIFISLFLSIIHITKY